MMPGMDMPGGMPAGMPAAPKFEGNGPLDQFIDKKALECLNESKAHPFSCAFDGATETYLQSDTETDNQLLLSVGFMQPVKISAMRIKCPPGAEDSLPESIKIFLGNDKGIGFDEAESREATQEFTTEEIANGKDLQVKFVKFQKVDNLRIFVSGSAGGQNADTDVPTKISSLQFIGQPCESMDMKAWKPVKG